MKLRCECCVKGKLARKPFSKASESRSTATLDLIYTDVCGAMRTKTPGNNRYILTIFDDYSRYSIIYLMQRVACFNREKCFFIIFLYNIINFIYKIIYKFYIIL